MASAHMAAVASVDAVSKTLEMRAPVSARIRSPTLGSRWIFQLGTETIARAAYVVIDEISASPLHEIEVFGNFG